MICILHYQLKYKNDPDVLELLRAYDEHDSALSVFEYTKADLGEAEQGGRDFMKQEIEGYADDIDSILDELLEGDDDQKSKACKELEKLVERMRF